MFPCLCHGRILWWWTYRAAQLSSSSFLAQTVLHMLEFWNWYFGYPIMIYVFKISEASLGPYAWEYKPVKRLRSAALLDPKESVCQHLPLEEDQNQYGSKLVCNPLAESYVWKDVYLEYPDLKSLPRSQSVFRQIELDPQLDLKLPRPGLTPGRVLEHCIQTFESLHSRNKPMTWKFGFTHNAAVRWHNSTYGYQYGKERYDYMLVLYATPHAHGAAFLEAALIDRFRGYLIAIFLTDSALWFHTCRNLRCAFAKTVLNLGSCMACA